MEGGGKCHETDQGCCSSLFRAAGQLTCHGRQMCRTGWCSGGRRGQPFLPGKHTTRLPSLTIGWPKRGFSTADGRPTSVSPRAGSEVMKGSTKNRATSGKAEKARPRSPLPLYTGHCAHPWPQATLNRSHQPSNHPSPIVCAGERAPRPWPVVIISCSDGVLGHVSDSPNNLPAVHPFLGQFGRRHSKGAAANQHRLAGRESFFTSHWRAIIKQCENALEPADLEQVRVVTSWDLVQAEVQGSASGSGETSTSVAKSLPYEITRLRPALGHLHQFARIFESQLCLPADFFWGIMALLIKARLRGTWASNLASEG